MQLDGTSAETAAKTVSIPITVVASTTGGGTGTPTGTNSVTTGVPTGGTLPFTGANSRDLASAGVARARPRCVPPLLQNAAGTPVVSGRNLATGGRGRWWRTHVPAVVMALALLITGVVVVFGGAPSSVAAPSYTITATPTTNLVDGQRGRA